MANWRAQVNKRNWGKKVYLGRIEKRLITIGYLNDHWTTQNSITLNIKVRKIKIVPNLLFLGFCVRKTRVWKWIGFGFEGIDREYVDREREGQTIAAAKVQFAGFSEKDREGE